MVAGMIPYHGFYPLPYGGYPSSNVHASPTTTSPSPVIDAAPVSDPHSAPTPSDNPADPSPAAPPGNPAPSPADLPAPASTTINPTSPTLNAAPVVPNTVEVPSIEPTVPGPAAAPAAVPPRHSPTGAPTPVAAFLPSRHAPSLPVSSPGVPPYQPFHYSPMPHPTPPTPASHASPLFPNAGQYRAVPLSPAEFARSNVLLSKFDRGSPGSREYKSNSDTICTAPNAKFRLSYVDTDTVADPTKFNIQLASTALSRQACLTHISNHIRSYDLGDSLLVPDRINYASVPHAPSGDRHDVLFHHTRFTLEYVQEWQFWCNGHHKTEDAASDRLLVVYFFKCLDGALLTEVTEDYYEIEADFRGAAVLVFLTMTKLQTNSFHCIQAYQGILMHFNISAVPEEKVSLASSWLKAVTKALQLTNDIPNTALSSILRGMQRSKHRSFNMFAAILASQHTRFTPRPGVDSSKAHMKQIFDTLDQLTQEYRMYKESGHWPMANAGTQSSALVTAPTPSGSSSTTSATKSKSANPRENRLCYNPDCLSPDHVIADCPVPLPPGYDRSRGRSRERASKPRGSSRSLSRGHSRGSSRGASRERRPSAPRAPTPAPKKSSNEKSSSEKSSSVAFANNVSVASTTADDASACSTTSSYDDSALQAFILRGPPKE